jgi:hypothetical protein
MASGVVGLGSLERARVMDSAVFRVLSTSAVID